jgi:hypothetical protein
LAGVWSSIPTTCGEYVCEGQNQRQLKIAVWQFDSTTLATEILILMSKPYWIAAEGVAAWLE